MGVRHYTRRTSGKHYREEKKRHNIRSYKDALDYFQHHIMSESQRLKELDQLLKDKVITFGQYHKLAKQTFKKGKERRKGLEKMVEASLVILLLLAFSSFILTSTPTITGYTVFNASSFQLDTFFLNLIALFIVILIVIIPERTSIPFEK